jgi:hypothetical protein
LNPQSQAPAVRERPGVIEATIYHILNEEMGPIALNAVLAPVWPAAKGFPSWLLAGVVSGVWGALAATVGPSSGRVPETMGLWLIGYSLPFAAILLVLPASYEGGMSNPPPLFRTTHSAGTPRRR